MRTLLFTMCVLALSAACLAQWEGPSSECGFLDRPPVYIQNEPDFPLTGLGGAMPKPGEIVPDVDIAGVSADHWNQSGNNVQPELDLELQWIRVGAMRGWRGGWAAGFSVPYYRNLVKGAIGGQPASSIAQGFGNVAVGGKKILWRDKCHYGQVALAGAIELPTGKDNSIFNQANFVTNGYYTGNTQRIPLGWQPSTGTYNGLAALSYTRYRGRLSYELLAATKIFGTDGQDVKVGNIFIGALESTYGMSRDLALSLGVAVRDQADDQYPNAPAFPGIDSQSLQGTTQHSTVVYLDAAVRYVVMRRITVGVGIRTPINTPSAGMEPTTQFTFMVYPNRF